MSDREFENYLALLTGMLRLRRTQREGISGELRDHLIEHVAQLEASGITHEEAVRKALEEFGDAAALAANFHALVGMRRRRLVMRCTIGTTVVMTGLVVAMLAFRPEVRNDPGVAQAQAEAEPGDKKQADAGKEKGSQPPRDPDQRTRLALKQPSSVDFTETPLRTVLQTLGASHGVQYYIDPRSLRDAGVDPDAPVTLNLDAVPFEMVLDLMLRELGLGYRIRNGVIMVGSEEDLQSETEVRVYELPHGGVEHGVGLAQELSELVPATIEIQSWQHHGGGYGPSGFGVPQGAFGGEGPTGPSGFGTLRVFRGTLVISQTPEVHQKIEKLLEDLGKTGALNPQRLDDLRALQHPEVGGFGGSVGPRSGFQPAGGHGGSFAPGLIPGATLPGATTAPRDIDPANPSRPNTPPTFEAPPGIEPPKADSR